MKKHVAIAVLAGLVSGCIFRDFCFGPFFGLIWGLMIGVPLALLIQIILHLIKIPRGKPTSITCAILIIICISTFNFVGNQPFPTMIFKGHFGENIYDSISDIKAHREFVFADYSDYLRFSINETDLKKLIDINDLKQINDFELSPGRISSQISGGVSFPENIPWFNLDKLKNLAVYYKETMSPKYEDLIEAYEYIIYDPDNKTAYYIYISF